jgi:hypothetical protein
MIERRDLFKIITAGALVSPVAATKRPDLFNEAQRAMIDRLADIIIPTDEQSPGAHDAGVVRFIDLLAGASTPERQEQWRRGLEAVDAAARARFGKAFMECGRASQEQIVAAMAENEGQPQNDVQRFFLLIKTAAVDGYRFSEIGIKQYMGWVGNRFETKSWTGACNHPEHRAKA